MRAATRLCIILDLDLSPRLTCTCMQCDGSSSSVPLEPPASGAIVLQYCRSWPEPGVNFINRGALC